MFRRIELLLQAIVRIAILLTLFLGISWTAPLAESVTRCSTENLLLRAAVIDSFDLAGPTALLTDNTIVAEGMPYTREHAVESILVIAFVVWATWRFVPRRRARGSQIVAPVGETASSGTS